jgi:hypothetical protein
VRNLCLFVVAALALGSPGPARGQAFPPDNLLGGDVRLAVQKVQFGGSCYINRGSSVFQRNGLGPISFDEIVDSAIWELRGQAVLTIATRDKRHYSLQTGSYGSGRGPHPFIRELYPDLRPGRPAACRNLQHCLSRLHADGVCGV